jgi:hypothetical protein
MSYRDRQTSPAPKLPWVSLVLLFLTYTTFGWLLYDWTDDLTVWLAVAFGVVILGGCVTFPSQTIGMGFGRFLKTDIRAFILIVIASILSVVLLTWFQYSIDIVVLCTAGLLVSLDLKTSGWSKAFSLILIIGWQLLGVSVGLTLHHFWSHPLANLPTYFYSAYWMKGKW